MGLIHLRPNGLMTKQKPNFFPIDLLSLSLTCFLSLVTTLSSSSPFSLLRFAIVTFFLSCLLLDLDFSLQSGSRSDPLCRWLYETYLSSDPPLRWSLIFYFKKKRGNFSFNSSTPKQSCVSL